MKLLSNEQIIILSYQLLKTVNEEIQKKWVGGVCIRDNHVLLIYRVNQEREFNKEYFVFPGGYTQDDESMEKTILRECRECSITVKLGALLYSNEDEQEYYYLCDYISGEPLAASKNNEEEGVPLEFSTDMPVWIPLSELDELIVYPESVKDYVLQELEKGD